MANFTNIHHQTRSNNQPLPAETHSCKPSATATLPEASPQQTPAAEGASSGLRPAYQSIAVSFMGQEQSPINHLLPCAFELYEAESRPLPFLRLSSSASDSYNYFSSE